MCGPGTYDGIVHGSVCRCVDVYADMHADMRTGMCTDMCRNVYGDYVDRRLSLLLFGADNCIGP